MATQNPPTNVLDHIVHLSPPGSLHNAIEAWRELGFNVIAGGTHADGLTENALVAFKDGPYIELISFTHPLSDYPPDTPEWQARKDHFWAKKEPGYIDFAFQGNNGTPSIGEAINRRAGESSVKVRYASEVKGGRTRTDGEKLEWLITAPEEVDDNEIRGRLPFFCGDLTSRDLRVPRESNEVTHPNKAGGIAYIRILTSLEDLPTLLDQMAVVTGSPSTAENLDADSTTRILRLQAPNPDSANPILLKTSTPNDDQEKEWLERRGPGLYEVGLRGLDVRGPKEVWTPYGKLSWVRNDTQ